MLKLNKVQCVRVERLRGRVSVCVLGTFAERWSHEQAVNFAHAMTA